MKYGSFSDAIRAGIKLMPDQAFGALSTSAGNAGCAFGAGVTALLERNIEAYEFHPDRGNPHVFEFARALFPYLSSSALAPCGCLAPIGSYVGAGARDTSSTLQNLIVHLNNRHRWTREAIADWLQAEEDKLGYETITEEVEVSKQELALATK